MPKLQETPIYQYAVDIIDPTPPKTTSKRGVAEVKSSKDQDLNIEGDRKQDSKGKADQSKISRKADPQVETFATGPSGKPSNDPLDDKPGAWKTRRLITILLEDPFFDRIRPGVATNYTDLLFTAQKLDLGQDGQVVMDVEYHDEIGDTAIRHAKRYKATISKETIVSIKELVEYLASANSLPKFSQRLPILEALNAIIARSPRIASGIFSGARNSKFFSKTSDPSGLGAGLIAIKGIYSSVRPSTQRLLLNINVTTAAFFDHNINLGQLMERFMGKVGHTNSELMIDQLEKFLAKRRIRTDYEGRVKTNTIQGLANEKPTENCQNPNPRDGTAESLKFERVDERGARTPDTVKQYFAWRWQKVIKLAHLPCVNTSTNPDNPRYIPAELCWILPGQPYGKRLSTEQTKTMLNIASKDPHENATKIIQGAKDIMNIASGNSILDVNLSQL